MREILFRGKKRNGEWVYGDLLYTTIDREPRIRVYDINCNSVGVYDVLPKTVGQYTGLTDKNGNKIFEGDILSFIDRLTYVHWHNYCGCWDCSYIKEINGEKTSTVDRTSNKWRYNAEVIGNIYDNNEFMKGV